MITEYRLALHAIIPMAGAAASETWMGGGGEGVYLHNRGVQHPQNSLERTLSVSLHNHT